MRYIDVHEKEGSISQCDSPVERSWDFSNTRLEFASSLHSSTGILRPLAATDRYGYESAIPFGGIGCPCTLVLIPGSELNLKKRVMVYDEFTTLMSGNDQGYSWTDVLGDGHFFSIFLLFTQTFFFDELDFQQSDGMGKQPPPTSLLEWDLWCL